MIAQHALVLNLHQPSGNLDDLLAHNEWEAKEILYALDRIPRSLWGYEDLARVHLSLSGTLLETLSNPDFQKRVYGIVDCGTLLWRLQNHDLFEMLGTGYYHPVLPLIPEADRSEHLHRWLGIAHHLFWRPRFDGFWPPEMGFSMEMIPLLRAHGYRYVMVDSEQVEAVTTMSWQELRYRPHIARHGKDELIVVVRDRDLSNAQESGMEVDWFLNEVAERTKWCDFAPLVTTCTDGENGGWFRNTTSGANFWSAFYQPLMERVRAGKAGMSPTFISDYLKVHGAQGEVRVHTGAWNTGWHDGRGFVQWTGSQAQKDGFAALAEVSAVLHATRRRAAAERPEDGDLAGLIETALWHLLRAETSCNFFWGEAWVPRSTADLDVARDALAQVEARLGPALNPAHEQVPPSVPESAPLAGGSISAPAQVPQSQVPQS